jgi:HD-GYP domain-containing protein (c-di-GMP phosphodiesterase class II)
MIQIDDFTEDINFFLKENNLPMIENEMPDFETLYKESVKSIWQNRNILKREELILKLNKLFEGIFENDFINSFIEKELAEFDRSYPAEIDIYEIYEYVLKEYNDFIKTFIQTGNLNTKIMDSILKRIFIIISENKNGIISRFILNYDQYDYLICHGINSTIIALIGGFSLGLSEEDLIKLGQVGLLHDLGMTRISENIIYKKDKLTEEEYEMIKTHPVVTYKMLLDKNIFDEDVINGIIQHHERYDGSGYPKQLKGDEICLFSKIISIADTFESQISYRAYRKTKSGYNVMKEVMSDKKYDSKVMGAFIKIFSIYPPGTIVQLNNNSIGIVVSANPENPLRPIIKIIIDEYGDKSLKETIKDLNDEKKIFILRVLNKEEFIENE